MTPRPLLLLTLTGERRGQRLRRSGAAGAATTACRCKPCVEALARCEARARGLRRQRAASRCCESCEALARAARGARRDRHGALGSRRATRRRAGVEAPWRRRARPRSRSTRRSAPSDPRRRRPRRLAATAAGFDCVKVKVGTGEDEQRLAAVRAAIGAPGADPSRRQRRLEPVPAPSRRWPRCAFTGLELCEEPVHGLDRLGAVPAAADVPVAADESAREPGAFSRRVCDAVCLKIARCGGISGLVRDAAAARAAGYEVYVASTLDGPLGIAAALHAVRGDRA